MSSLIVDKVTQRQTSPSFLNFHQPVWSNILRTHKFHENLFVPEIIPKKVINQLMCIYCMDTDTDTDTDTVTGMIGHNRMILLRIQRSVLKVEILCSILISNMCK